MRNSFKKSYKYLSLIVSLILMLGCKQENSETWNGTVVVDDTITEKVLQDQAVNNRIIENIKTLNLPLSEIQKVDSINTLQKSLIDYIFLLRDEIVHETGGIIMNPDRQYPGNERREVISKFFIGNNKDGKAYELQRKLNHYSNFLNQNGLHLYDQKPLYNIALNGNESPIYKNNNDTRTKDFAELNFKNLTLTETLTLLSIYSEKVISLQRNNLNKVLVSQLQPKK